MKNNLVAAVFMRTNGADTEDLYNQLKKCEQYAYENEIKIEGAYTDFQMMLKGEYDIVLVADKARISRNAVEYSLKEQALKHKGMKIVVAGNDLEEQLNQKVGFNLADKAKNEIEKAIRSIDRENEKSELFEMAKEAMLNSEVLKKHFEESEQEDKKRNEQQNEQ